LGNTAGAEEMDIHFSCTSCGNCCRNLRVPLTVAEASAWLERGHAVELLMDALPWADETTSLDGDAYALYRRDRAFPAHSGGVPVHITVTLTAQFEGACPNLAADLRCTIYEDRPLACRIYPAEFNPFVPFERARKGCPPEAWRDAGIVEHPLLLRDGQPAEPGLQSDVAAMRAQAIADVETKAALCSLLGIHAAALANEGLLVFRPVPEALRDALARARSHPSPSAGTDWTVVTNRRSTADTLRSSAADAATTRAGASGAVHYLAFLPDEP
jgi:Fe-S-cluster containining protein